MILIFNQCNLLGVVWLASTLSTCIPIKPFDLGYAACFTNPAPQSFCWLCASAVSCWVVTDSSPNPFLQNMDFMHCWCFKREIHCLLKGKNSQTLKTCYLCLTLLELGEALGLKFTGQKLMLKELWRIYPTKHLSGCKATSQTRCWLNYLFPVES